MIGGMFISEISISLKHWLDNRILLQLFFFDGPTEVVKHQKKICLLPCFPKCIFFRYVKSDYVAPRDDFAKVRGFCVSFVLLH